MKPIFSISKVSSQLILLLCLLTPLSCTDPVVEDVNDTPSGTEQINPNWAEKLPDLLIDPANSIFVQSGESIQEAIDAASPGSAIYLEPGVYREELTFRKTNLSLIGLDGASGEQVILEPPQGSKKSALTVDYEQIEFVNIEHQYVGRKSQIISREIPSQARLNKRFFKLDREYLGNNIAHYKLEIRVGNREFDVIRIHHVVKEYRPYFPVRTQGEIMMIHGASQDFDDIFLTAGAVGNINEQTSSPYYLAAKGIDVWGIDLAWTLVPAETSDFGFMQDWGVERDVDHTLAALAVARLIRGLTGQGFGKLNLLGFSYGVPVAYAAAGRETQKHPILRGIKGIIPVEAGMKYDTDDQVAEEMRKLACAQAAETKETINGGTYVSSLGVELGPIGNLAQTAPDDSFPFPFPIPNLTNAQVAIAIGAGPNPGPAPFWHFVAGQFDENGVPLGLTYTDANRWFYLLTTLAPHMPQRMLYEFRACQCDEEEVSIDDYLDQITVPILYLGAGGGFGNFGDFTGNETTASSDVTNYTVSLMPPEARALDFGHADPWMASNAPQEVWQPLSEWLMAHSSYAY